MKDGNAIWRTFAELELKLEYWMSGYTEMEMETKVELEMEIELELELEMKMQHADSRNSCCRRCLF